MNANTSPLLPEVAAERKRTGADRWDEVWEGVLHVPPSPNRDHQRFQFKLVEYLEYNWAKRVGGAVYHDRNVAGPGAWTENYRVPDLTLLTSERLSLDKNEYVDGGPDVVVEIESSGDEAYAKLPFYAEIGVREVWIIDRDSKVPEIHCLSRGEMSLQPPAPDGWHASTVTGLQMKADGKGRLLIRKQDDPATERLLPD